jgi:hypothetical protein
MKGLIVLLAFILVLSMVQVVAPDVSLAASDNNLLTNPGAESGDMSGWTIIANGGNGWTIDKGGGKEGTNVGFAHNPKIEA